jgi:hypothetical protein
LCVHTHYGNRLLKILPGVFFGGRWSGQRRNFHNNEEQEETKMNDKRDVEPEEGTMRRADTLGQAKEGWALFKRIACRVSFIFGLNFHTYTSPTPAHHMIASTGFSFSPRRAFHSEPLKRLDRGAVFHSAEFFVES